eukprot:5648541-Amphidinium_carterae.1
MGRLFVIVLLPALGKLWLGVLTGRFKKCHGLGIIMWICTLTIYVPFCEDYNVTTSNSAQTFNNATNL